jgi:hypothetical protein
MGRVLFFIAAWVWIQDMITTKSGEIKEAASYSGFWCDWGLKPKPKLVITSYP